MIAVLLGLALLAPLVAPYPFDGMSILKRFKPPSGEHWFGTDEYGRDVLSRTLYGARLSLVMGIGATMISLAIGVPLGLIAGYRRGAHRRVDHARHGRPDVVPADHARSARARERQPPALWKAIVAVGIVYVPVLVRVTRSVTLELVHEEFIQAAQRPWRRHRLHSRRRDPAQRLASHAVEASLRVTFAILLGAALSFLGMGAQPPSSDWGLMIAEARPFIDRAPWIALAPGIAMCVTVSGSTCWATVCARRSIRACCARGAR